MRARTDTVACGTLITPDGSILVIVPEGAILMLTAAAKTSVGHAAVTPRMVRSPPATPVTTRWSSLMPTFLVHEALEGGTGLRDKRGYGKTPATSSQQAM